MKGPSPRLRRVFAVTAFVVIASTVFTFLFGSRVLKVRAHRNAIRVCEDFVSTLKDAETGQRGFLLSGDESYLQPYHAARARLTEEFAELVQSDISRAQRRRIAELSQAKLSELEQTIAARRNIGLEGAAALLSEGSGKRTMDSLREETATVQREQQARLDEDESTAATLTRTRTGVFALSGLVNLLFVLWAYRRMAAEISAREAAIVEAVAQRTEVQHQKDLLAVTLASIGDCVMITDAEGRITFMNSIAEQLTGWSLAEAHLRPTADVFRIINETAREKVISPVDKVLEHGVIVGLANHTLLVRKDGSEVAIDDSGAPIRDADGTVHGVVLVFRDFSEHKESQRLLHEAKEKAETASKAKDQFLAMLSHELRTPLTPVLTTLHLWEASDELPPAIRGDAQMLRRNVELEARIIDDLLDLTRIAKGMLSFSLEDADLHELLQFIIAMSHSEFHGKEVDVMMNLDAERHHVRTDAGRLQQVF